MRAVIIATNPSVQPAWRRAIMPGIPILLSSALSTLIAVRIGDITSGYITGELAVSGLSEYDLERVVDGFRAASPLVTATAIFGGLMSIVYWLLASLFLQAFAVLCGRSPRFAVLANGSGVAYAATIPRWP